MNYHPQTSFAQLQKNGSIKVQFKAIQRRQTPMSMGLRSKGCRWLNKGLLAPLEGGQRLGSLLKNLCFRKNIWANSELVASMPNHPHHHSHEFQVFFFFSWNTLIRSLVFEIAYCLRSSKMRTASHISSSMAHCHNAWTAVSNSTPHYLHLSSNKIVLLSKLCFVGIASLHTRHIKCHTLLGTLSPQIWFQIPLCHC